MTETSIDRAPGRLAPIPRPAVMACDFTSSSACWALPSDDDTIPLLDSTSAGYSALRVLIGLALLTTTAVACRALAAGTGNLARALLR